MSGAPRKCVEIEVNRDVVSLAILSEVAKIDRSVRFVVGVPPGLFEVFLWDVSFASVLEDDIGFV